MQIKNKRVIFHIDIDAFFASAATLLHPEFSDKPVAVGSLNSRTSIIASANYLARKYGVRAAMQNHIARQLCPSLVILPSNFNHINELSAHFVSVIKRFSPNISVYSIDEVFVDFTNEIKNYHNNPLFLAYKLQAAIKKEVQLDVSIGIGSNNQIAKMATSFNKPKGITIIKDEEFEKVIFPLPVGKIPYIGKNTEQKLKEVGIVYIKDLYQPNNIDQVKHILGANYDTIISSFYQPQYRSVFNVKRDVYKSLSRSTTLPYDTQDYQYLRATIIKLANELILKLDEEQMETKVISISYKYFDFKSKIKQINLPYFCSKKDELISYVLDLFYNTFNYETVRAIGLGFHKLVKKEKNNSISLFD
ncbi:Y-family DNA polymerase [Ureaplasma canigenitalium]|uniref:Y-family DNA polymerase n=1 Tax=Ureaplasma canigenitalium TaxID=42092 RepID=UPI0004E14C8A|nr:DNA polymerase IV [Ureaplasma canigenitalium]